MGFYGYWNYCLCLLDILGRVFKIIPLTNSVETKEIMILPNTLTYKFQTFLKALILVKRPIQIKPVQLFSIVTF